MEVPGRVGMQKIETSMEDRIALMKAAGIPDDVIDGYVVQETERSGADGALSGAEAAALRNSDVVTARATMIEESLPNRFSVKKIASAKEGDDHYWIAANPKTRTGRVFAYTERSEAMDWAADQNRTIMSLEQMAAEKKEQ